MRCPKCGGEKSKVIDTRPIKGGTNAVRRRRLCLQCGDRFTTYELPVKSDCYNGNDVVSNIRNIEIP